MRQKVTRGIESGESADDQLDDVEKRARWDSFSFVIPTEGKVNVANHSHGEDEVAEHTYTVTVEDGEATDCTCPAAEYHGFPCNHALAVEQHEPVLMAASGQVAADGGEVLDAEPQGESGEDGRPDDCDCDEVLERLDTPCWACYRDGFETPAPQEDEDESEPTRHEPADFGGGESTGVQDL